HGIRGLLHGPDEPIIVSVHLLELFLNTQVFQVGHRVSLFRGFPAPSSGWSGTRSATQAKLCMALISLSKTSNTVYSFVICSRPWTRLVRLSSFMTPPWLVTVVHAETSSPIPELSM